MASRAPAGRTYGGQTAEDRAAARRARFIEAGVEVFGTVGLRGATVRGLCAAAGLTDRYFYESFGDLPALLQAVHAQLMDDLGARLARETVGSTAWAGDRAAVAAQATRAYERWFDFVRDPRVGRIVLVEVVGVSAALDAQVEASMDGFVALTVAPLAVALPGQVVPEGRRLLIGRALQGAALHLARSWMASGYAAPREDVVGACVLIATGTLAALREAAAEAGRPEPVSE